MNIFYSDSPSARVRRGLSLIAHSFFLDLGGDHTNTVFVCGSGRSGATWIADLLNFDGMYRPMIEPFTRALVPICRSFSARQYVRPDDDDPAFLTPARAIFTGSVRNAFIDQTTPPMIARRRLIKDDRTTLMLKWIRNHFRGMPIVYVIRHPSAVALSRRRLGWRTDRDRAYLDQTELIERHLRPFLDTIRGASSTFERHVVDWCVENYVPLRELEPGDAHIAFYENVCAQPESELGKIFAYAGRSFSPAVLARLEEPSKSPKTDATRFERSSELAGRWTAQLSAEDLRASERITKAFGLDGIYAGAQMVDVVAFERWRSSFAAATPGAAAADTPT